MCGPWQALTGFVDRSTSEGRMALLSHAKVSTPCKPVVCNAFPFSIARVPKIRAVGWPDLERQPIVEQPRDEPVRQKT